MPISRYNRAAVILAGSQYGTSDTGHIIFKGVESGIISANTIMLKEGMRLDSLAGRVYKDATLWWVIAAASGIGWGMQVPPGTVVRIPTNLSQVLALVG
jgi:hypothetical protein